MAERGDGLGLALESHARIGIRSESVGQDLHRDIALEACVSGPIDVPHTA